MWVLRSSSLEFKLLAGDVLVPTRCKASVAAQGQRHPVNRLQNQGLTPCTLQDPRLLSHLFGPPTLPWLEGMLEGCWASSFLFPQAALQKQYQRMLAAPGSGPSYNHSPPRHRITHPAHMSQVRQAAQGLNQHKASCFAMEDPQSPHSDSTLRNTTLPPSPTLTLQLIDAAVVHAVPRFPLQLLQVPLILTRGAPVEALDDLIEFPQQIAELVRHGCREALGSEGLGPRTRQSLSHCRSGPGLAAERSHSPQRPTNRPPPGRRGIPAEHSTYRPNPLRRSTDGRGAFCISAAAPRAAPHQSAAPGGAGAAPAAGCGWRGSVLGLPGFPSSPARSGPASSSALFPGAVVRARLALGWRSAMCSWSSASPASCPDESLVQLFPKRAFNLQEAATVTEWRWSA